MKKAKRGAGKNKRSELIKQGINCAKCCIITAQFTCWKAINCDMTEKVLRCYFHPRCQRSKRKNNSKDGCFFFSIVLQWSKTRGDCRFSNSPKWSLYTYILARIWEKMISAPSSENGAHRGLAYWFSHNPDCHISLLLSDFMFETPTVV